MAQLVYDSFTTTSVVPLTDHIGELGATWIPEPRYLGTLRIDNGAGQVYSNPVDARESLNEASAVFTDPLNLYARYVLANGNAAAASAHDNFVGFCYGIQQGALSFYRVRWNASAWLLESVVNGVPTTLASSATPVPAISTSTIVVVAVSSGVHSIYIGGSLVLQATNTAISLAGFVGIWGSGGGSGSDNAAGATKGFQLRSANPAGSSTGFEAGTNDAAITLPSFTVISAGAISAFNAYTIDPPTGGAVAGGSAARASVTNITPVGGAIAGGTAPISGTRIAIYNISDDGQPSGGAVAGGSALVQDVTPAVASGGIIAGGAAVVQDHIPFIPSGGGVAGGTAANSETYAPPVSGGAVASGAAPVTVVYAIAPLGGAVAGGAAFIADRSAFHSPAGGVILGGQAVAYMVPAGFTPTAANPLADPFPGWALNYDTGAPSRILGLPANSFAGLNGVTYVANADGIYALDAKADAGSPIRARVMLPETDYGSGQNKRVPNVWIAGEMAQAMVLKVVTDNADENYYTVDPPDGAMRASRVQPGKGVEGRFIRMGLGNVQGGDFTIESLEVPPSILKRHGR